MGVAHRLEKETLESSPAERDLRVVMDGQLNMGFSVPCQLRQGHISYSVAICSREGMVSSVSSFPESGVLPLQSQELAQLLALPQVGQGTCQFKLSLKSGFVAGESSGSLVTGRFFSFTSGKIAPVSMIAVV